ncbi:MAG: hypothetical protein HZB65_03405 [Candidatus Aenigmarchaeota archaeon]|nr:hypothetical protein [Candidatus Aenigmarchaeota archaeon]
MGLKTDLMIGIIFFAVIALIVGVVVGLFLLAVKALAILLILLGIFMMFLFPDSTNIQIDGISETGVIVGFIVIMIGVGLLFL